MLDIAFFMLFFFFIYIIYLNLQVENKQREQITHFGDFEFWRYNSTFAHEIFKNKPKNPEIELTDICSCEKLGKILESCFEIIDISAFSSDCCQLRKMETLLYKWRAKDTAFSFGHIKIVIKTKTRTVIINL